VETAIQPDGRSAPAAGKESQAGSPESSFATGLQLYWAGSYARAEDWFADAVHRDGRDARFYYFLGLARWSQGRLTEARRDFERASALEKQDSPSRAAVNAVLERVQGGMRRELDYYRK
jgi:Flp pilus assembly protein TadD